MAKILNHYLNLKLVEKIYLNKIIIDSFVVSSHCHGLKILTDASEEWCYCPQEITLG